MIYKMTKDGTYSEVISEKNVEGNPQISRRLRIPHLKEEWKMDEHIKHHHQDLHS
jgi:hypothetical protein